MAQVPATDNVYTGDGTTTQYAITFDYLEESDVKVSIDGVNTSFTFATPSLINLAIAPAVGSAVRVYRDTPAMVVPYVFSDGVPFLTRYADFNWKSLLYVFQEAWSALSTNAANLLKTLRTPENLNILPNAAGRANKVVGFDDAGQPQMLPYSNDSIPGLDLRVTDLENEAIVTDGRLDTLEATDVTTTANVTKLIRDKSSTFIKKSPSTYCGRRGTSYSAIVVIGDSNAEGAGSTGDAYINGYCGQFFRAVANSFDTGVGTDRGFRYESVLNLSKAGIYGVSANGTLINGGVCDSRLSLADGQEITITNREINTADVSFVKALSAGSLEFRLNGNLYKTYSIATGVGTYPTTASPTASNIIGNDFLTKPSDVVTIRCVGGPIVITEIMAVRKSTNTPLLYAFPRQGWGFTQFADSARVTEGATYINRFAGTGKKLVYIMLGTNDQSAVVGTAKSPTDYINALNTLLNAWRAALDTGPIATRFIVVCPHKTKDPRPLGTWEDYINALQTYCDSTVDVQLFRLDTTPAGYDDNYLTDERHFNDFGHALYARALCFASDVPPRFDLPASVTELYAGVSYTPVVFGTTVAGTNGYAVGSTNQSFYLREGSKCNFSATITLTSKDAAMSGNLRLRCTPISGQGGNKVLTVTRFSGVTFIGGAYTQLGAVVENGTNSIALIKSGSGLTPAELTIAEISGTFSITLGGDYLAQ